MGVVKSYESLNFKLSLRGAVIASINLSNEALKLVD